MQNKLIKRVSIGIGVSVFFFILISFGLKWASQAKWNNWKKEWQAKGEDFDIASNIPKKIPDNENFAKTEFFAPFYLKDIETPEFKEAQERFKIKKPSSIRYNWRKGKQRDSISWESAFFESDLAKLATDLKRPYCRFDIQYQNGYEATLPHLSTLKNAATLFSLRAGEKLARANTNEAMQDTLNGIQLGELLQSEPFLISQLVRIAILDMSIQTFWEGQVNGQWSTEQLREFQEKIKDIDLLKGIKLALKLERNMANQWFADINQKKRNLGEFDDILGMDTPSYIRYFLSSNQYQINKIITEDFLSGIDISKHKLDTKQIKIAEEKILELKNSFLPSRYALVLMLLPALDSCLLRVSQMQTSLNQANIVAALELYRLKNNKYPSNLNDLKPDFISIIRGDLFHDKGLVYRVNEDNSFSLYSTGYNEKDDEGEFFIENNSIKFEKGDWPWPKKNKE